MAARLLAFLEGHLAGCTYLAANHPTIADLACYSYVAHAPEGGIPLNSFPAIRAWLGRVEAPPAFYAMPPWPSTWRDDAAMDTERFHPDELTAQRLAGGGSGGDGIRDNMPDQHRAFFAGLPYVAMAAVHGAGWAAATILTGVPGFIQTPDAHTLLIRLGEPGDLTLDTLAPGQDVGVVGIDFATSRRNRANGVLEAIEANALTMAVGQSFGNCPKYI